MSKNSYRVSLELELEADNENDAERIFWNRIDDNDYPIKPEVKRLTEFND